jgi:MoxR-like ATPase
VFIVIATQNPIEQEGTYLLSEAQTDRFIMKERITYPTPQEEVTILERLEAGAFEKEPAVLKVEDIDYMQAIADKVYVDNTVKMYISFIIDATRNTDKSLPADMQGYVRMGASPRGSIAFLKLAKAAALMNGRDYVIPDDVKMLSHQVLRHRLSLSYSAIADDVPVEDIIDKIVGSVRTP